MNPFEMVVIIVAIVIFGNVLKTRYQHRHQDFMSNRDDDVGEALPSPEARQLREEVQSLKQRIQVLERIAVEKENSLTREIEQLRDR